MAANPKYPPFVNAYGNITKFFPKIKSAAVPTKFSYDYLKTMLGFTSSSYQAMVPFLKKLGFLDQNSVPTQVYKDYRDESLSRKVMAQRIKAAYSDLYQANEFAHKLPKEELVNTLTTMLGVEKNDKVAASVASSFLELVKLADFDGEHESTTRKKKSEPEIEEIVTPPEIKVQDQGVEFGISYTINLNLPPTTEVEVFNAIFKSLRENILDKR